MTIEELEAAFMTGLAHGPLRREWERKFEHAREMTGSPGVIWIVLELRAAGMLELLVAPQERFEAGNLGES